MNTTSRRRFLGSAAATAAAMSLPRNLHAQAKKPERLRIACVGVNGKGASDLSSIAAGNEIRALCDVDTGRAKKAFAKYKEARQFSDYREMFSTMGDQIDAVTVSTPDHMHYPVAVEAIQRGIPVFVQKPMCNRIQEARDLGDLAKRKGVMTVMGNQGATNEGTRRVREWIEAGLIGEVTEAHYWTNRPIWAQGPGLKFPAEPVPDHLNWDVWQGTVATERPYSSKIHPFAWRGFWDYGCGALGDIGCHSINSAFWALDLRGDFSVEATEVSPFDETIAPKKSRLAYSFPARGKRGPVKMFWYDGIKDVNEDKSFPRPKGVPADFKFNREFGQIFIGSEGVILCNDAYCSSRPLLFPESLNEKARTIEKSIPRVKGGPTQELCQAIRGEVAKPVSNFVDHAGPLTELVLVGNLAVRLGGTIEWDSAGLKAPNRPEAAAQLGRQYREGWKPNLA